jgi:MFS family permease
LRSRGSRAARVYPRAHAVGGVLKTAFVNPDLRRVGFGFALFGTAELAIWIALLVYAYDHGGTAASTTMVLVQLLPCVLLGPLLGAYADRHRPLRVLTGGYALQVVAMDAVATAMVLHAPVVTIFVLAPLTALSFTITRPAQAALFPAVVRTAEELTAANVMCGWTTGAASLLGPALAGVGLELHGPALVVIVTTVLFALALVLVSKVRGMPETELPVSATPDSSPHGRTKGATVAALRAGLRANVAALRDSPPLRILLSLHAFYYVLVGAVDLLCVVLAASYLHMGPGGAGYLNASFGAGALLAGFVSAFLVGRRRLKNTLVLTLLAAVVALALVSTQQKIAVALLLLAATGLAGSIFDVSGRTLLQRSAPSDAVAGLFSVLEALMDLGIVLGAVLVQVTITLGGIRAALLAPAVAAGFVMLVLWTRLRRLDQAGVVPHMEVRLLRAIPIFAVLPAPTIEGIARELEAVSVPRGATLFHEGDPGDRYYAVSEGALEITRRGVVVRTVSRGQGFGEIALIRDVPRSATVTAVSDARLYALRKDLFLQTVTGHAAAARVTGQIIAGHVGEGRPAGGQPQARPA